MTTNYPASLDTFPAVTGTMADTPTHSARHTNLQDAIAAIQAALGTSPAGSWASVKARLEAIEADSWVTSGKIANGAIVDADINAAAAIGLSKLSGVAARATIGNLLTDNQATGTDTLGDTTGLYVIGGAWSSESSTDTAAQGARSWKVTRTSPSALASFQPAPQSTASGYAPAVVPGEQVTVHAGIKSGIGTSPLQWRLRYYGSNGAVMNVVNGGAFTPTTDFVDYAHSFVVPDNAYYAVGELLSGATGSIGDTLYFDRLGMWSGAGGVFRYPGTPIPYLGIRPNPSNTAQVQVWNALTATWITV